MNERETPDGAADLAFERALLASARTDELPAAATEGAWLRFAAAAGALGAGAVPLPVPGKPLLARSGWGAPTRWLVLGAVAGSAVTSALLGWPRANGPAHVAEARDAATLTPVLVPAAPAPSVAASATAAEVRAEPPSAPRETAPPVAPPVRAPKRGSTSTAAASTLAAEIAALDGVRRAMAAGDFERALDGTAAYSREFPRGQLAADADALAAQALAAQGEHAAASERAARFLERHPEDPHAARMRRLLQR